MLTSAKKYFFINALAKGISVLELLAENGELTVSAVAEKLGFNRAGSHRFLATLRELGYVEKKSDNRYFLTVKLLELGMKVANHFEIRKAARPFMQELSIAFRETVNLGYLDGLDVLHLDKIDGLEILRMDSSIGSRAPAYCTALGKAILAFLPSDQLHLILDKLKLEKHGPNTIVSKKELVIELDQIRNRGFAIDNEELSNGLRCVSAPVFDHTGLARYSISVAGPTSRLSMKRIKQIQKHVKKACDNLSRQMGNTPD